MSRTSQSQRWGAYNAAKSMRTENTKAFRVWLETKEIGKPVWRLTMSEMAALVREFESGAGNGRN